MIDASERSNDVRVESWCELCERLYDNSWQDSLLRFRSNYAFRGLSDTAYDLKTSFMRRCGAHSHLEYHLLRNFSKYAEMPWTGENASNWRWLTVAQHHGLPTRLLDWTYSPFVAAHFATADTDQFDCDGAIWFADYVKINKMLPHPLSDELINVGANAFTLEMLEHALGDIKGFDALGDDLVLFFEPPSIDARIVNQFAFFSVMSSPTAQLDLWLEKHPEIYGRIIIPRELKWEIRDKLDQANITERTCSRDWTAWHCGSSGSIHPGPERNYDGSLKSPISALRFIPRHCGVRLVRLISRDLQALISNLLRNRPICIFFRLHQL